MMDPDTRELLEKRQTPVSGRPATPDELGLVTNTIPPEVFDVVNGLLAKSLTVMQNRVVEGVVARLGCKRQEVFDRGWLDFESAYQEAGWVVEYDKPGYNEGYEAHWRFSRGDR